jgi:hypothetical protein
MWRAGIFNAVTKNYFISNFDFWLGIAHGDALTMSRFFFIVEAGAAYLANEHRTKN